MSARAEILGRIAAAGAAGHGPAYDLVSRDYRAYEAHPAADLVELLIDRLVDYKARVRTCSPDELAATIAAALTEGGIGSLVVPPGLPAAWLSTLPEPVADPLPWSLPEPVEGSAEHPVSGSALRQAQGAFSELVEGRIAVRRDDPALTVPELDATDGVLTGCAVAIAETGTLILDAAPDQGRRAITLVPDYHLCVVTEDAIVPDVPQALPRLDPTRPLTMISGPSATSDIELNRVEGVHGPRTLEVIVVTGSR